MLTLKPVRLDGRDIPEGKMIDLPESLVPIWIQHANARFPGAGIPDDAGITGGDGQPLSLEEFEALGADEQKAELQRLEIEGDTGNKEKRVALYAEYLNRG